jgi:hypothetical protein
MKSFSPDWSKLRVDEKKKFADDISSLKLFDIPVATDSAQKIEKNKR